MIGKEIIKKGKNENLIWMDLEMTGLEPLKDKIMEIAIIPTDINLNILDEGICFAIKLSENEYINMNEWSLKTHSENGLIQKSKNSGVTLDFATKEILKYLNNFSEKGFSPMCGNSIHQDRFFLKIHSPELHDFFHYRNIDVSTIKELAKRWNNELFEGFTKKDNHTALSDIKESIEELKYYKKYWLKKETL